MEDQVDVDDNHGLEESVIWAQRQGGYFLVDNRQISIVWIAVMLTEGAKVLEVMMISALIFNATM